MGLLSEILTAIGVLIINLISYLGYFGIFLLMIMESMIIPIPSELVMPFAGFLIATGEMSWWLVILFSSLGSVCGSLLSYYLGSVGGNRLVLKLGKYIFLDEEDLVKTEQWFSRKGEATIFIGRLIPAVRHLISIPAGIGKMNLRKFLLYTLLGATLWNTFLAYLGFLLGKNWGIVRQYSEPVSLLVAVLLVVLGVYFIYKHVRHKIRKRRNIVQDSRAN